MSLKAEERNEPDKVEDLSFPVTKREKIQLASTKRDAQRSVKRTKTSETIVYVNCRRMRSARVMFDRAGRGEGDDARRTSSASAVGAVRWLRPAGQERMEQGRRQRSALVGKKAPEQGVHSSQRGLERADRKCGRGPRGGRVSPSSAPSPQAARERTHTSSSTARPSISIPPWSHI